MTTAEEDFQTLVLTLEFFPDESLLDVTITIIDDELVESDETFVVYLMSYDRVTLFPHAWTNVTIEDDDGKVYSF